MESTCLEGCPQALREMHGMATSCSSGNVLHVEARNSRGQVADDIDDFIVDNVVIVRDVPSPRSRAISRTS
jgi:hypothetical protein